MPGRGTRVEFTKDHDTYLIKYLATYCPTTQGRRGNKVYIDLVENAGNVWPWARHHTWHSWRTRYVKNTDWFDRQIVKYQKKHEMSPGSPAEKKLVKGSVNGKDGAGRSPIKGVRRKRGEGNAGEKRNAEEDGERVDAPKAKRAKLEIKDRSTSGAGAPDVPPPPQVTIQQPTNSSNVIAQGDASPASRSKKGDNIAQRERSGSLSPVNGALRDTGSSPPPDASPHRSPLSSNQALNYAQGVSAPYPMQSQSQPITIHPDSNVPLTAEDEERAAGGSQPASVKLQPQQSTNGVHSEPPSALHFPPLLERSDTLVLPSSPHRQPSSPTVQAVRTPGSPPYRQRRFRERPRAQSEVFASVPPSPQVVQPGENLPSSSKHVGHAPPSVSKPIRAPPRVVETFFGPVLVDQKGRVPRRTLQDSDDESSDAEPTHETKGGHEEKQKWPPVRSRVVGKIDGKGKEKMVHDPHTFHRPAPQKSPPSLSQKPHHPFSQVNQARPHAQGPAEAGRDATSRIDTDRRAAADQFLGKITERASKPNKENVKEDAPTNISRIPEREVVSALPSQPKRGPRETKFPPPRASTRSPFRLPEPPHPPVTSRLVHPALARVRRQTFGGRDRTTVPSIDLIAMSTSASLSASTSHRSSSTSTTRSRRSLPAHLAASLFGDRADHSILWPDAHYPLPSRTIPRKHSQSPSLTIHDRSDVHTSISTHLVPHPADIPLVQLYGLDYALGRMSENHGLALSVVEAVYERVHSLPEADVILRGMREAAEDWGEAEISRLSSEAKEEEDPHETPRPPRRKRRRESDGAQLRYIPASSDGERSEYSPPETTRAARWKRQSLGRSRDTPDVSGRVEVVGEGSEDEDEDEARRVDKELFYEEPEDTNGEARHQFSQHLAQQQDPTELDEDEADDLWRRVFSVNQEALRLERKVGKHEYRKRIVSMFK